MKAKQANKDNIFVYSSFKQFCFPVLEFLVPSYIQLGTETRTNVITVIVQIRECWVL